MVQFHRRQFLASSATLALGASIVRVAWAAVRGTVITVINKASSSAPGGGEASPVAPGQPVNDGIQIETAKESAVEIQLAEGGNFIIGARSTAAFAEAAAVMMQSGRFRHRPPAAAGAEYDLGTPTLRVTVAQADFVVEVKDNGDTICGVQSGSILCTAKRNSNQVKVGAGQSVVWAGGSFGNGVTEGVYRTGDPSVDNSLDAARAVWAPPPEAPQPQEPAPAPTPPPQPQ